MSKLRQLHDRYGQSPWLDNRTRAASLATTRCGTGSQTDMFPGQHDRREK
jgi:hypothetical protein